MGFNDWLDYMSGAYTEAEIMARPWNRGCRPREEDRMSDLRRDFLGEGKDRTAPRAAPPQPQCPGCGVGQKYYRCRRCGVVYQHIHKYSDCGSPGCNGERVDDAPCPTCGAP